MMRTIRISTTNRRYFVIAGLRYRIVGIRETGIYAMQFRTDSKAREVFLEY